MGKKYSQIFNTSMPKRLRRIVGRYMRRNRAYYEATYGVDVPKDMRCNWALLRYLRTAAGEL